MWNKKYREKNGKMQHIYPLYTQHNKDEWHSLLEKYISDFIWKGCVWEGVGDRTELQHIDPNSYGHLRFFPVLLGYSPGGLGPNHSGCWFSLLHLISNSSDPQTHTRVPRAPSVGCWFLYSIIFQLSDLQTRSGVLRAPFAGCCFLYSISYIIVQRPLNIFP